MEFLKELAAKHGISVIEDAAQAHCALYKGTKVGSIGDLASWSYYPGKNLGAWGEAGAVTTNKEELFHKTKMLRDHGSPKKYYHEVVGFNYRMSEFQAAVLNVKMKYIEEWTELRRQNAIKYHERLKDVEGIIFPSALDDVKHVFHLYVIRAKDRDALQEHLKENGVASGLHYPFPLHMTKAYSELGYKEGDFPVAEKLAEEILSLPMYSELSEDQIDYVCEKIKTFYHR
jgi:dTDP-4-amino-4,6-dideoxygalactose transaminase